MEQLSFKLEVFEGPLDLLLHLIAKHKLDIQDIEISSLLEQYLEYIAQMKLADLEVASEFLENRFSSAKARGGGRTQAGTHRRIAGAFRH